MGDWSSAVFGMDKPCDCDEGLGIEHKHLARVALVEADTPFGFRAEYLDPTDIKIVVDWKQYARELATHGFGLR